MKLSAFAPLVFLSCCLASACGRSRETAPSESLDRLILAQNDDGDLEYCDDRSVCHVLSNPRGCELLEIDIALESGASCERCLVDGAVTHATCEDTSIDCVLVTVPEPDCVVCAYVGGAIIYSSCAPSEPYCDSPVSDEAPTCADGDDAGCAESGCTRCYDQTGHVTYDDCGSSCEGECPPCPEGEARPGGTGECCAECAPVAQDCDMAVCPAYYPECPDGTSPHQAPNDCCRYVCEPTTSECSPEACGPAPGAPNYECPDGQTVAGPSGRCLPLTGGGCGWEIVECPESGGSGASGVPDHGRPD